MTAMIDAAGGALTARNGDVRQMDGTRQARWLYDLEQALLEQGLKPYQASDDEQPGARAGQDALPNKAQRAAWEQAGQVVPGAAPVAAQAQAQAQAAAQQQAEPQAAAQPAAAAQSSAAGTPAFALAQPARTTAPALAALPVQALAAPDRQHEAQPAQAGVDAIDAPAALRGAAPLQRAAVNLLAARNGAPAGESELQEPTPSSQQAQAPGEPFEKKLLHLFYGRDGVHAFVRDAELQAEQMRSLAQNLASELGGEGRRLASLTVNGRKVDAARGTASEADDTAQYQAPQQDSTRSIN
ncbi:hypothetical protein [Duganella sp. Root198D2]|uniref:hypothetical protein n=1 Tax=Duganella sp. Root198D2 TaxID=1736489 RepID=UPI000712F560|nr:hypothetical protein [Duganella sp. Root198D2]KRB99153.1 hypothetical protein ASE26_24670 [Duganella sp. Root198D2]